MWGQGWVKNYFGESKRIIPTRVGTRVVKGFKVFNPEDHPHACGDKFEAKAEGDYAEGSSPRVWGQE